MKILVIGSKGFIGSNVLSFATRYNHEAVGISRQDCDFLNSEKLTKLIRLESPDFVVNAAGIVAGIFGNLEKPFDLLYKNSELTLSIASSCLNAQVTNYLSFSAACIYPSSRNGILATTDLWGGKPEISSLSYATSKLMALQLNESINAQFGLNWKTVIPSNLYGHKENILEIEKSGHVLESLISRTLIAKNDEREILEIWGDGTPQRTFLSVKDLASATIHIMEMTDKLPSILNVNGGTEISIKILAEKIAEFANFKGKLAFNPNMPNGATRKNLDDEVLRSSGWKPETDFEVELKSLVAAAAETLKLF